MGEVVVIIFDAAAMTASMKKGELANLVCSWAAVL
jgi:hypothetical protein